jgi:FkbM family methyltransferase
MGIISKAKRSLKNPEKLNWFIRSRVNEVVFLINQKRFGALLSYIPSGITNTDIYGKYMTIMSALLGYRNILVRVRDYEMLIDLCDRGLSKELYLYGTREHEIAGIFENELNKIVDQVHSPLIIEAGANIGYYTILEANIANGDFEIIAIEPSEENIQLLRKNICLNGYMSSVSIHQCAIDSETGDAILKLSEHSNLHQIQKENLNEDAHSKPISTWRLDDFLSTKGYSLNNVNVIRMDIEGAEMDALDGMLETLNGEGPTLLFFEVHNNLLSNKQACELPKLLAKAGFEIIAVENTSTISSPFSLTIDVDSWDQLSEITDTYGLIAKKE